MKIISRKQIILLHEHLLRETGGAPGLKDEGLLDSAISAPFQSFDNTELFPTEIEKAARLCFGLVKNHAFVDGNKRIGAHTKRVLGNLRLSETLFCLHQDFAMEFFIR